jgi:plastocyanin
MKARWLAAAAGLAAVLAAAGSAATTAEITMPGRLFAPHELDVLVGTTVTWRNTDHATHTVTEDDDVFDSGHLRPGGEFAWTFTKTGTFAFHCTIHRFMRGSVSAFAVVLRGPAEPLPAGRRAQLEGIAPAGVTEVVLDRLAPGSVQSVARAAPDEDGAYAFTVRAPEPRLYRVRAGAASSPVVLVRVSPRVSIDRASNGISVLALPSRAGSRVALQVYDREAFAWVTAARGRLDARSRATIEFDAAAPRSHVRAVVLGRGGWSDGASRPLVVTQ